MHRVHDKICNLATFHAFQKIKKDLFVSPKVLFFCNLNSFESFLVTFAETFGNNTSKNHSYANLASKSLHIAG